MLYEAYDVFDRVARERNFLSWIKLTIYLVAIFSALLLRFQLGQATNVPRFQLDAETPVSPSSSQLSYKLTFRGITIAGCSILHCCSRLSREFSLFLLRCDCCLFREERVCVCRESRRCLYVGDWTVDYYHLYHSARCGLNLPRLESCQVLL